MVNWLEKSVFSAIIREFVFSESPDLSRVGFNSWGFGRFKHCKKRVCSGGLVLTVGVLEVIKSLIFFTNILVGFNSWGFGSKNCNDFTHIINQFVLRVEVLEAPHS